MKTASYSGRASINSSGNVTPSVTRYDLGTNVQIKYIVSNGQIQLTLPNSSVVSFSPSELNLGSSSNGVAVYTRGEINILGNTLPAEVFEVHAPSISGVPLSYTRFGTYAKNSVSLIPLGGSINPLVAFAFGVPTEPDDVPDTGTASYNSDVYGVLVHETGLPPDYYTLGDGNGSATFGVDFASGVISTLISLDVAGQDFGDLTGTGAILSGGPAFNGTISGAGSGGFTGAFFGPNAQEMGYVFQAEGSNFVTYGNVFGVVAPPP